MTWTPRQEMLWKLDPNVTAARKHPGWVEFHRECGKTGLFFDHIEKQGRQYVCTAFTLRDRVPVHLADGRGSTVIESLEAAYQASGRVVPGAAEPLDILTGRAVAVDELEDFIG